MVAALDIARPCPGRPGSRNGCRSKPCSSGAAVFSLGFAILLAVLGYWSHHHYTAIKSVLPAVVGVTLIVIGAQNALGGFLLAIINGNEAEFLKETAEVSSNRNTPDVDAMEEPARAIAS